MTLWNIIRDWFVVNVWGGSTSSGNLFSGTVGLLLTEDYNLYSGYTTSDYFINFNGYTEAGEKVVGLSLGDWLSTTSTIIVLCVMCFFLFLVVRWLFRLTSGLLSGRG